MSRFIFNRR